MILKYSDSEFPKNNINAMFKVIVAGGRDFNDYQLLSRKLDELLINKEDVTQPYSNIQIISGAAKGADSLGEIYAIEKGYDIKTFPADWDTHGRRAGYIRNKQMRDYANACVVFWNGRSKGSKLMIDLAKDDDLPLRVINY